MASPVILAIDQGTTSTRALLCDQEGVAVAIAQCEFAQYYPKPGWVWHEAMEIWESVCRVVDEVLTQAAPCTPVAIGITNQRETIVMWERATGRPIHPAIVWQSRQTADACRKLQEQGLADWIRAKTGLVIDAYFSATKIQWLLDHVPEARERAERGELLCGTIDTWLIWKLTDGQVHVTDVTNASRTMLYNIHERAWDDDLLALFAIPKSLLPTVRSSSEVYGTAGTAIEALTGVPVAGAAGDQQAALFGQAGFAPGAIKNTYGTGCFLLMHTGKEAVQSHKGLLTTVACEVGGAFAYALEGSVFIGGAAVQWLRDGLGLIATAAESELLARQVASSEGVYLVPAFVGLGAPHWDMDARGALYGLTRGTTKAHVARATLESLAYQTRDLVTAMEQEAGLTLSALRVDGGAVANELLMQIQADVLGVPVWRAKFRETTALGAAFLAGLAVGVWRDLADIERLAGADTIFTPTLPEAERERLYFGWLDAVERTRMRR